MQKISIPAIYNSYNYDREKLLEILKKCKAFRLMLAIPRVIENGRIVSAVDENLKEDISFFESHGFEVCVWLGESIGHGWPINETAAYCNIVSLAGETGNSAFCPTDELFVSDFCAWVKNVARAGAKQILLDDDFRMSMHGTPVCAASCLCEEHLRQYNELIGEQLTRAEIAEKVFTGGPSRYRNVWYDLMRSTMLNFAKKIRTAVDEVDSSVRVGVCATYGMWDLDGAAFEDAGKILAGKNKALLRLCGAPYWARDGYELANVITLERMAAARFRKENTELLSEGDTYPRPRTVCPAAYLETFEQALVADGGFDGALKYMLEYDAPYDYETGYIDRHIKNRALIDSIEKAFAQGCCAGLRLFENFQYLCGADLPNENPYENANRANMRPRGIGCRFVSALGLPVAFNGEFPVIVFGENAKYVTNEDLKNGAILDIVAADILQKRGTDVGMKAARKVNDVILTEHFVDENIRVTSAQPEFYDLEISDAACTLTYFEGKQKHIGAYLYENKEKQRFLVYSFDGENTDSRVFKAYARQREVNSACEWLCGKKLPAVCTGNPATYTICKMQKNRLSVAFWNLYPDEIVSARFDISEAYTKASWLGAEGEFKKNSVVFKNVAAYSFCGFVLEK